jgi:hypothetical protein
MRVKLKPPHIGPHTEHTVHFVSAICTLTPLPKLAGWLEFGAHGFHYLSALVVILTLFHLLQVGGGPGA